MSLAASKVKLTPLPPVWFLRECFWISPDIEEGLRWRFRPRSHFTDDLGYNFFNERWAGEPAGWECTRYYRLSLTLHPSLGAKSVTLHNHRVIWGMSNDMDPAPYQVDHKDRNRKNNAPENLRIADNTRNAQNGNLQTNNKSGRTGVAQRGNSWRARITVDGHLMALGQFPSFEAAVAAREAAEVKYFGQFRPGTETSS